MLNWIKALIILPFNVLIVIPLLILYFTKYQYRLPAPGFLIAGIILFAAGMLLAIWTMLLFARIGNGTPAPWMPPKHLIVKGPYCYVRNPMITGVLLMLAGEFFLTTATQLLWWLGLFFLINSVYFPLSEEKHLEERFQDEYLEYKKNVPRWIPRLTPWRQIFKRETSV